MSPFDFDAISGSREHLELSGDTKPLPEEKNVSTEPSAKPQKKYKELLLFYHGLGDVVMFGHLLPAIRKQFPDIDFTVALQKGCGFTPLIDGSIELENDDLRSFDSVKEVKYYMAENSGLTKNELCAQKEFGFEFKDTFPLRNGESKKRDTKIVGVCFQGTCLPNSTNPSEEVAKEIWQEIKEAGYIPLEIMFEHIWHNPINKKYDFIDNTTRSMKPDVQMLMAILRTCDYFIGVASGVWVVALTQILPKNVCLLEKAHKITDYMKTPNTTNSIVINNYRSGSVKEWLKTL